jgi:signal peptidase II
MINKLFKNNWYNIAIFLFIAIFFIVDRFLKNLALKKGSEESINLFFNNFYFNFQANENIAFSLPIPNNLAIIIASFLVVLLISCLVYLFLKKISNKLPIFLLFTIILGAISNLLDRYLYGYVVDYLNLTWFTVFNLADVMISLSAFVWIFLIIFKKDKEFFDYF